MNITSGTNRGTQAPQAQGTAPPSCHSMGTRIRSRSRSKHSHDSVRTCAIDVLDECVDVEFLTSIHPVQLKTPQVTEILSPNLPTHIDNAILSLGYLREPDHFRDFLCVCSVIVVRAPPPLFPSNHLTTHSPSFSGQSISAQCQSRLADIVASPDAQCINAAGLAPIFVGDSNTSVVGPINTWLNGMCPKDACSNQTLAAFVTNITQGCSSDFSSLGLNNDSIPSVTTTVQTYYPTVRQILCLKKYVLERFSPNYFPRSVDIHFVNTQ